MSRVTLGEDVVITPPTEGEPSIKALEELQRQECQRITDDVWPVYTAALEPQEKAQLIQKLDVHPLDDDYAETIAEYVEEQVVLAVEPWLDDAQKPPTPDQLELIVAFYDIKLEVLRHSDLSLRDLVVIGYDNYAKTQSDIALAISAADPVDDYVECIHTLRPSAAEDSVVRPQNDQTEDDVIASPARRIILH